MSFHDGVEAKSKRFVNGFGTAYRGIFAVAGARTPLGRINGSLGRINCTQLGRIASVAALERSKIDPETIDQVIFANAHPSSLDALFLPRNIALPCKRVEKKQP